MLGERERPGFQNKNSMSARSVVEEQVTRQDRSETPATQNDQVERPRIGMRGPVSAGQGLVQAVAHIPSQHVQAEVGGLGNEAGRHDRALRRSAVRRMDFRHLWPTGLVLDTAMVNETENSLGFIPFILLSRVSRESPGGFFEPRVHGVGR